MRGLLVEWGHRGKLDPRHILLQDLLGGLQSALDIGRRSGRRVFSRFGELTWNAGAFLLLLDHCLDFQQLLIDALQLVWGPHLRHL